jgi:hypothetical protein
VGKNGDWGGSRKTNKKSERKKGKPLILEAAGYEWRTDSFPCILVITISSWLCVTTQWSPPASLVIILYIFEDIIDEVRLAIE